MTYRISTNKTWEETITDLDETFRKWHVSTWHTTPQRPPRRAYQTEAERSVTLSYIKQGNQMTLVSKNQHSAQENLRALYLAVERMRLIEAAGLTDIVRQAYAQLPPPATAQPANDPYAILGVQRSDPLELIEAIYRARMHQAHPDHGGSTLHAATLNGAIEQIRREHHG